MIAVIFSSRFPGGKSMKCRMGEYRYIRPAAAHLVRNGLAAIGHDFQRVMDYDS
ncbi:MAG: hypothetical protein LUF92_02925 [Clostridiales bacterium]|nr:hypothetical protein [Clostridiales bacterium]